MTVKAGYSTPMLHVAEIEKSIRFYEVLGFTTIDTDRCVPIGWARLQCEDGSPVMFLRAEEPVDASARQVMLCLHTPDLAALRERLLAGGVEVPPIDHPEFNPGVVTIADPDGYKIRSIALGKIGTGSVGEANQSEPERITMKKVFHFDAPRETYHCDAAILCCFDNRFDIGFRKFLKRIGVVNSDHIKVAGGAKCLASPELETDREFVLEQIRKSIRLHGTTRVILMVHSDCGAYGGLTGGFGGNAQTEAEHHQRELGQAAANLLEAIPGIEVQGYFVDFEGIWDAGIASSQLPEERPLA
jgi:hypothetical protein